MDEFFPGDVVEFVDDKTVGTVIRIINDKQVLVDIDGIDIPVMKSQLIRISEGQEKSHSQTEKYRDDVVELVKENRTLIGSNKGLFVAISIGNSPEIFQFHLVNDSPSNLLFTLFTKGKDKFKAMNKGELQPWTTLHLLDHDQSASGDFPILHLNMIPFSFEDEIPEKTIVFSLKASGKDLLKKQEKAPLLNSQAWLFKIEKEEPEMPKIEFSEPSEDRVLEVEKPAKEIDLHIEKIDPNFKLMNRDEIFHVQFKYFVREFEKAIAFDYSCIIVIHGIGVNTLKDKIREFLKNNEHVKGFHDADVRKYGFGATEIIFRK
ncbi:Smr/MutS family protein [Bacteroidota bacterium]